jgi:hypothetical protein
VVPLLLLFACAGMAKANMPQSRTANISLGFMRSLQFAKILLSDALRHEAMAKD